MSINIKVSPQYQGVIEKAGDPQNSNVMPNFQNFDTIAALQAAHAATPLPQGVYTVTGVSAVFISDGTYLKYNGLDGISAFDKYNYLSLANAIRKTLHGTSNTRIMMLGDSITSGFSDAASNDKFNGYPIQLCEIGGFSIANFGFQSHFGLFNDGGYTGLPALDSRLAAALPTGWGTFLNTPSTYLAENTCGFVNGYLITNQATGPSNLYGYQPSVDTDTFNVYYIDNNPASYDSIDIKAGATEAGATLLSTTAAANSGRIKKASGTTTLGANTYWFGKHTADTKNVIILGWDAHDSTKKEISIINCGVNSQYLYSWATKTPTAFYEGLQPVTGKSVAGVSTPSDLTPDAVVIGYGVNHWANATGKDKNSAANFKIQLEFVVSYLLASNIPVIIMAPPPSPISVAPKALQDEYIAAMHSVAATYELAIIDVYNAWRADWNYGYANGWYRGAADVHPSRVGYNVIANYFSNFIREILK